MNGSDGVLLLEEEITTEGMVGRKLRSLRKQRNLSLRELAERSGLSINTLSLVENGKSSPSVSTLQQLAQALDVPIATFFETRPVPRRIVFTSADKRPQITIGRTQMQNLGKELNGNVVQPFVADLQPGAVSGDQMIVHTGHEFVYCLSGTVCYQFDGEEYLLHPGDSLVFEAHLPHRWKNCGEAEAKIILIFFPADQREEPGGRHFPIQ